MSSSITQPDRDELARLLEAAGSTYDPDAIEALIDGVVAAPAGIGTGWHRLVADPMPQQLADCLEALRAAKAAGYHDGLSRDDFARQPRSERLARLRKELASRGLDGFIVPRADEHQGGYVPSRGQRLAWLTGFTGSAGLAIVLRDRAALFVDGRYTLQAAAPIDAGLFEIRPLIAGPPARRGGAVCGWALHIAGGRAGRCRFVRDPSPDRGAAGPLDRHGAQSGNGARL